MKKKCLIQNTLEKESHADEAELIGTKPNTLYRTSKPAVAVLCHTHTCLDGNVRTVCFGGVPDFRTPSEPKMSLYNWKPVFGDKITWI